MPDTKRISMFPYQLAYHYLTVVVVQESYEWCRPDHCQGDCRPVALLHRAFPRICGFFCERNHRFHQVNTTPTLYVVVWWTVNENFDTFLLFCGCFICVHDLTVKQREIITVYWRKREWVTQNGMFCRKHIFVEFIIVYEVSALAELQKWAPLEFCSNNIFV